MNLFDFLIRDESHTSIRFLTEEIMRFEIGYFIEYIHFEIAIFAKSLRIPSVFFFFFFFFFFFKFQENSYFEAVV